MHKQDPFLAVSLSFIFSLCCYTTLHSHAECIVVLCAMLPDVMGREGMKERENRYGGGLALLACHNCYDILTQPQTHMHLFTVNHAHT